jgi:hypothetical protein
MSRSTTYGILTFINFTVNQYSANKKMPLFLVDHGVGRVGYGLLVGLNVGVGVDG